MPPDTWARLADQAGLIFAAREWLETWWDHYGAGRRRLIGLVQRDGAVVAIVPLYVWRSRGVQCCDSSGTDRETNSGPFPPHSRTHMLWQQSPPLWIASLSDAISFSPSRCEGTGGSASSRVPTSCTASRAWCCSHPEGRRQLHPESWPEFPAAGSPISPEAFRVRRRRLPPLQRPEAPAGRPRYPLQAA